MMDRFASTALPQSFDDSSLVLLRGHLAHLAETRFSSFTFVPFRRRTLTQTAADWPTAIVRPFSPLAVLA